jgi:hypothetical protein
VSDDPVVVASDPGTVSAPGTVPNPPRSRALYDPETGKLDVRKLAAWIGGAAALIGTLSATSARISSGIRWWLDIDSLETRVTACESELESIDDELHPHPSPRDANARLSAAIPRIAHELRDARKERETQERALTRLSNIHEYSLHGAREREAAREARQSVQWRREPVSDPAAAGTAADDGMDAIESLEGL